MKNPFLIITLWFLMSAGSYGQITSGKPAFNPSSPVPIGDVVPNTGGFTYVSATQAITTQSYLNSQATVGMNIFFGQGNASYPGIKRSGTGLLFRLGDDSAGCPITAGSIAVATQTPASAAATGTTGTITWDASFIYVCTATNTWKRVAIATW